MSNAGVSGDSRFPRLKKALLLAFRISEFPASLVASRLQTPLKKHWTRTYMLIGIATSVLIVTATVAVQPAIRASDTFSILYGVSFYEYVSFTSLLRRQTLSLFEASTCLTKLAIIRVSSIRNLASMMVFAVGLTIFLTEIEIKISSPLAGTFTYLALNISYLTSFRIHPDKERAAIFDGLKEVKALPRFYQSMTLQKIMQLVRRRIRTQLRLAKDIGINPLSRLLYLEYATRPNGPSSQAQDFVTKLREGLGNSDSDVVNLINNAELLTTEDIKRPISFQLPWEKPINWVQILSIIFGILDAITAIFYLRAFGVFDFIYRTLSGGS